MDYLGSFAETSPEERRCQVLPPTHVISYGIRHTLPCLPNHRQPKVPTS